MSIVNETRGSPERVKSFKLVNCLFTVFDTEGDDLPELEPLLETRNAPGGTWRLFRLDSTRSTEIPKDSHAAASWQSTQ